VSDGLQFDVGDITKMLAEFKQLPGVLRGPLARGAAKAVMTELRDRAIAIAPIAAGTEGTTDGPPPGNLKRAIYAMRIPEDCTNDREVWKVDVRKGAGTVKRGANEGAATAGAYYAGWVEYGHWTRTPATAVSQAGSRAAGRIAWRATGTAKWVPAQPFMRPALDSMKSQFATIMQDYIGRNLPEALATFKFFKPGA